MRRLRQIVATLSSQERDQPNRPLPPAGSACGGPAAASRADGDAEREHTVVEDVAQTGVDREDGGLGGARAVPGRLGASRSVTETIEPLRSKNTLVPPAALPPESAPHLAQGFLRTSDAQHRFRQAVVDRGEYPTMTVVLRFPSDQTTNLCC